MAKLAVYYKICVFFLALSTGLPQANAQYTLQLREAGKGIDPAFATALQLKREFAGRQECVDYVNALPALLQTRGYPAASVDSIAYDSTVAFGVLYLGEPLKHIYIVPDSSERVLITQAGWDARRLRQLTLAGFRSSQERMLDYLENNGYPFATLSLENVRFSGDSLYGVLTLDKGPLYRIDSIRNLGAGAVSPAFLQQYLGIRNGSPYRKDLLQAVSDRLRELPYVREQRPWDLTMLGTGSILNLYLEPRKSSEINVLVGLLPSNEQLADRKMLVTGEATINLKNALGGGETIGLNWEQLQVRSPRLNILFRQPYLFGSPFGATFNFDLFKKDSSFLNITMAIGATYAVSTRQSGSVFIQRLTSNLLSVDTFAVKRNKSLLPEADLSSTNLGISYEWNTTDYRPNPRKGSAVNLSLLTGIKNIRRNNVIVKLYEPADPDFDFGSLYDSLRLSSYQFRLTLNAMRFLPLSRASTLKLAVNGGWFQSPDIFRNELFQIGGHRLLRGFDEESIFASAYGVATVEYRYLLGQNSYLAAFADYGSIANRSAGRDLRNSFIGGGLGMAFETKAGIFNIAYAAGKRDDQPFNLRQSKIHLGYVNYF